MISKFSVKNFRSVKEEVVLSFEANSTQELEEYYVIHPNANTRLLKLGIIFGANASGKTTILFALDFLRELVVNPFEKKTDSLNFKPFAFDEAFSRGDSEMELEFFQNGIKYLYNLTFNGKSIVRENLFFFRPNKALLYRRETDGDNRLAKISLGSKIQLSKKSTAKLEANTLWNNTVLGGFLKTNIEFKELQEVTDWFEKTLRSIVTPRTDLCSYISKKLDDNDLKKSELLELMKKAGFKISDIVFNDQEERLDAKLIDLLEESGISEERIDGLKKTGKLKNREIFFKHEVETDSGNKKFELPFKAESEGTQRFYEFAGLLRLMINHHRIFPIDELESSLHPDLLKHFLLTFLVNTNSSQLIATTHYRELLIEKDILRRDAIWFTEKSLDGATELFSLDDFESGVIRNTTSYFNAYRTGKLGAVPELSDFYLTE